MAATEILELVNPGNGNNVIDQAIWNEAEELVNHLNDSNGGQVSKENWKTAFGTIFDKVKPQE